MSEAKWLGTSYPPPEALPPEQLEKMRLTGHTREQYETMVQERALRDRAAPKVGARAPDFEIERLTPAGKRAGEMFRLSSTRGRTVAEPFMYLSDGGRKRGLDVAAQGHVASAAQSHFPKLGFHTCRIPEVERRAWR